MLYCDVLYYGLYFSGGSLCDEALLKKSSTIASAEDSKPNKQALKFESAGDGQSARDGESAGDNVRLSSSLRSRTRKGDKQITLSELAQHSEYPSIWITVNNKVYDVTNWAKHHPGGEAAIRSVGGRDATDLMSQFHKPEVWQKRIENWLVGHLVCREEDQTETRSQAITREFRELGDWLTKNGWYKPSYSFIAGKMCVLLMLLSAALCL